MTSSTDSTQQTWTAAIRYITGRKAAEEALGFLAHISAVLDAEQEAEKWGLAVAQACVPFLASAVSLEVTGADEPVVVARERFLPALDAVRAAAADAPLPFVLSDHEKLAEGSPHRPAGAAADAAGSAVVVRPGFRRATSGLLVLLRAPEHPKGAFGPADVALITELGHRIGLANAYTTLANRASITPG